MEKARGRRNEEETSAERQVSSNIIQVTTYCTEEEVVMMMMEKGDSLQGEAGDSAVTKSNKLSTIYAMTWGGRECEAKPSPRHPPNRRSLPFPSAFLPQEHGSMAQTLSSDRVFPCSAD